MPQRDRPAGPWRQQLPPYSPIDWQRGQQDGDQRVQAIAQLLDVRAGFRLADRDGAAFGVRTEGSTSSTNP